MKDTATTERLTALIDREDPRAIEDFLGRLSSPEIAYAISRLDEEARSRLITLLTPAKAADILRDLPDEQAAGLIAELEPGTAAAIVDRLPADERADLLGGIGSAESRAILQAMPVDHATRTRELLLYPPDTAGGLMTAEFLSYPLTTTVGGVIDDFERNRQRYAEFQVQYLYLTDQAGRLAGVLRLRDLLLAPRESNLSTMTIPNPVQVGLEVSLIQLKQLFDEHHFMGVPVVDSGGRIRGVVERTAVEEAHERAERNSFLRVSGIIGGEEFRSAPFHRRVMRRLAWLTPNIALNIMAASVIALYQDTLRAAIALAVFLPIISDMSGCSGNQAVAVSIRELSLGLLKPGEFARVFAKESSVGLINGMVLGLLLGLTAFLWKGNVYLGLVVATALAANTLLSVLIGGSVPLLLKRLRVDPALASGPVLTTITDMCGFFLVLSIAQSIVEKL
ncbi:MAG: magnesium transporter [Bacteroidota bacterium]